MRFILWVQPLVIRREGIMICPKCMKQGFSQANIWYPSNMQSVLKCRQCEERSELKDWLVPQYVPYSEKYPEGIQR